MTSLTTEIEIDAPPAVVREKFLDFTQLPTYSPNTFFKFIESPKAIPGSELKKGDTLKVALAKGMTFNPTVTENSPKVFSWLGSIPVLFSGEHKFTFNEAGEGGKKTLLVHEEKFWGLLAWTMSLSGGGDTKAGFEAFNKDLKAWVEKM